MSPSLKRAKTCRICIHESQGKGRRIEKIETVRKIGFQTRVPRLPLGSTRWGTKLIALDREEQGTGDLEYSPADLPLPSECWE